MVLRKPYAFFIKHFKLFHLFLSVFFVYSIFRMTGVISFLNNYSNSNATLITMNDVTSVYNNFDFIIPVIILALCILLLTVMSLKKKPNKFYMFATITSIVLLIVNIYGYVTLKQLTVEWLEIIRIDTLADIYIFVMISCMVSCAISISRAIGFNISRFDFNNDILQFDLSEEDNAEFEVVVDFDVNDLKRNAQKKARYFKYFLKENKSIIIWTSVVIVVSLGLYGVFNFFKYNKTIIKTSSFSSQVYNGFTIEINNSYIINNDLKGNKLEDNKHLLVVDVNITNNGYKEETQFLTGTVNVNVGNDNYYTTKKYDDIITDLGKMYNDEKIRRNTSQSPYSLRRLLVFEVPKNHLNSKILFGVRDFNSDKTIYTQLKPTDLSKLDDKDADYKVGDELDLKDSTIGDVKIKIDSYAIATKFKVNYNFCTTSKVCINSIEYLVPTTTNSRYDKTLLKLTGSFEFNNDSIIDDFYKLFANFGYIEYRIGDKLYRQDSMFKEIKSSKLKQSNVYYIEVNKDIEKADSVYLGFKIRNMDYRYYLAKGNG